jgi:pimeloyl-ACP methyl ester carboxylesterase
MGPLYPQNAAWKDPSPLHTRLIGVDRNVRLEVLDWGGSGRPIVLLAGGGDTAHVFDDFAAKLTANFHVYGITRRGFGASDYAATDDASDRLGDDVVAVIDALKLKRPILVGHSIAGAEMSSIANRHPDRVAALIYLDAAYSYAFDNGKGTALGEIQKLHGPQPPPPSGPDLASFTALQKHFERVYGFRFPEAELREEFESTPEGGVGKERDHPGTPLFMAMLTSSRKFTAIPVPALIFFANPHGQGTWVDNNKDPSVKSAEKAYSDALSALVAKQETAVRNAVPKAKVITLPGAHHYVYLSNEADVLREMRAFISRLH